MDVKIGWNPDSFGYNASMPMLFQNAGIAQGYRARLDALASGATGFEARRRVFLDDRYGACHLLWPVDAAERDVEWAKFQQDDKAD